MPFQKLCVFDIKNIPGRVLVICVVVIGCSKIMPFDLESVLRFSCLKTFFGMIKISLLQ